MNREGLLADDAQVVAALRRGDDDVFGLLMDEWDSSMLRLAMVYVPSRAVAEEVLQETWLGVIRGIDRFEGRSSLKTWVYRILVNTAKTRGTREKRSLPFSSVADDSGLDPDRFHPDTETRYPGHWALGPSQWPTPEEGLLAGETQDVIGAAIAGLPVRQREVITMRDVDGATADECCSVLELTEGNQRVLLHRARTKVRAALERYFGATEEVE